MAFTRGKYGVEFDPRSEETGSPVLGWAVVAVLLVAAVSLSWTLFRRTRASAEAAVPAPAERPAPPAAGPGAQPAATPPAGVPPAVPMPRRAETAVRSSEARNLLYRREEAEKKGDVELEVSTIERLRALPDRSAADLDNVLARRLGELNARWMFELGNAKWVKTVTVRPGQVASRIAAEHGATLESLRRLNPGVDLDRLQAGRTIRVLDHPEFNLIVYPRRQIADLQLSQRFFKRYDLTAPVRCEPGPYRPTGKFRAFLAEKGLTMAPSDVEELAALLPRSYTVTVSDE